jgi:hypothetical protein
MNWIVPLTCPPTTSADEGPRRELAIHRELHWPARGLLKVFIRHIGVQLFPPGDEHAADRTARARDLLWMRLAESLRERLLRGIRVSNAGARDPPAVNDIDDAPVREARNRDVRGRAKRLGVLERLRQPLARGGEQPEIVFTMRHGGLHGAHRGRQLLDFRVAGQLRDDRPLAASDRHRAARELT